MLVRLSVVRRASRSWSGTRQAKRSLTPSLNRKSRAAACIEVPALCCMAFLLSSLGGVFIALLVLAAIGCFRVSCVFVVPPLAADFEKHAHGHFGSISCTYPSGQRCDSTPLPGMSNRPGLRTSGPLSIRWSVRYAMAK